MPAPVFSICEEGSTPDSAVEYTTGNRISFAASQKGIANPILTVDVWNDREGSFGSDTALEPILYASNDDDANHLFNGTTGNGFTSMLECRSCLAYRTPADQHTAWTKVRPGSPLVLGPMPSVSKRTIEMRLNIPFDATTISLRNFRIWVDG